MGLGRKVWGRERLTADDVNGYLMDQTVMTFASAAARDAAIPAPTEGMLCYLLSVGRYFRRGSGAWVLAFGPLLDLAAIPVPMQAGYVVASGRNPAVWLDPGGFVHMVGAFVNSATFTPPAAAGLPSFILAPGYRPSVLMNFACASSLGTYNLEIATTGAGRVVAPLTSQPANTVFGVDGVHFPAG